MKSGFVAVVGKPNTGKSTLINALTGRKVSIVSEKPQTTRFKLRGILNRPEAQIIFVDTPGFHQARDALGTFLNSQVTGTLKEVDLVLFLVDGSREITNEDRNLAAEIRQSGLPCFLAITKKDLCREEQIEFIRTEAEKMVPIRGWVSVSAVKGEGLEALVSSLISFLPEGPALYPEDMVTDFPLTIQAAEIIREKILQSTYQEVPHSVAVEVLKIEEKAQKNLLEIQAEIYVEKDSQKKIIIGREGAMIKKIGTLAREELEYLTGKKVFLGLQVKVKEKWKEKEAFIKKIYRS
ncbi:MAG: GTPase Era [Candidatus Saccharicenans sp.]|uniref:GTPase Era n=1 Tax=Candidatus Saccharicenans sp. TaxID=2819258 RepID=UPI0040495BFE